MIFWIVVAGLLALVVVLLVIPVLRAPKLVDPGSRQQQNIQIAREKKALFDTQLEQRELDQSAYDEAIKDLQTSLALDLEREEISAEQSPGKWAGWLVGAFIPLMSIVLYLQIGEYRVIENPVLAEVDKTAQANTADHQNMSIEQMLEQVKQRLQENPEDADGWFIMGRTLMAMQQVDSAVTAFQRTYELVGEDPDVMITLADAMALQNNGSMAGEPEQLVKRALEISPRAATGLWLAGLASEQRQDYKAAHRYWRDLLPLITDDNESTAEIQRLLAILEKRDPTIEAVTSKTATEALPVASIRVSVDISDSLKSQAAPGDAVFIYAKAMQGPPMPLAVKKLTVEDLPVSVSLSDSDAMMPAMKLSSFNPVIVGARVSKSGNPVAQAGDLFVEVESIDSKNPPGDLKLIINQVK